MEAMKMTYREAGTVMLPNLRLPESQARRSGNTACAQGVSMAHRRGTYTTLLTREPSAETSRGSTGQHGIEVRLMTGQMAASEGERTDESRESDTLDAGDEQHQSVGGGNRAASADRGVSGQETDQITEQKNEPAQNTRPFLHRIMTFTSALSCISGRKTSVRLPQWTVRVELFDGTLIPLELETRAFLRPFADNPLNDRLRIGYVPQPVVSPPKPSSGRRRKHRLEEPIGRISTAELGGIMPDGMTFWKTAVSDPTWADGVNMNLVQGRIVANRRILTELCGDGMRPPFSEREEPREMPNDYMAKPDAIRQAARHSLEVYRPIQPTCGVRSRRQGFLWEC